MSNPFAAGEPPPTLTVSQLNRQVKTLLESHFDFIWVEGEVSNFVAPSSGHWYFSLKDGDAQVRCAMFRNRNQRARFTPDSGDALRMRARVSLYEGRGEFQLVVEHIEHAGAGALQAAFEKLKARLLAEGLFDSERKRELPAAAERIGVITSPSGAAIHDILTVLQRRCPAIQVYLLPVAVQGDGAAAEIAAALANANRWQRSGSISLDALIVGRGGGSLEDLWAFNEEVVARAIADSEIPVVSAVGHEVDFTIADMVADHRAATPSAAAELLSPDQREWLEGLEGYRHELARSIQRRLMEKNRTLEHLQQRLRHPGARLREQAQRIDDLEQRLVLAQRGLLRRYRGDLTLLDTLLQARSPGPQLQQRRRELPRLRTQLAGAMQRRLAVSGQQIATLSGMLESLSPLGTLQRGYAILSDSDGKVIRDAATVAPGDSLQARLGSGRLGLSVESVESD